MDVSNQVLKSQLFTAIFPLAVAERSYLSADVPARKFPRPEAPDAPGLESLKDGDVVSTEGATLR